MTDRVDAHADDTAVNELFDDVFDDARDEAVEPSEHHAEDERCDLEERDIGTDGDVRGLSRGRLEGVHDDGALDGLEHGPLGELDSDDLGRDRFELGDRAATIADGSDHGYAVDPFALAGTALADVAEPRELELRHRRPSRWGRLDLSVVWRRRWMPVEPLDPTSIASAAMEGRSIAGDTRHTDTLWLVATWRK